LAFARRGPIDDVLVTYLAGGDITCRPGPGGCFTLELPALGRADDPPPPP
jgi:hypothetical protein